MYRKGTILLRKKVKIDDTKKAKQFIVPLHVDMIKEKFWIEHNEILDKTPAQVYEFEKKDGVASIIPSLVKMQVKK